MRNRSLWHNLDKLKSSLKAVREIGILTDVDGTISEICADPKSSIVSPTIKATLAKLNKIYPLVAVVSGRRAMDAQALVGQKDLICLGNHGLEFLKGSTVVVDPLLRDIKTAMGKAKADLINQTRDFKQINIEDKGLSLAVHYRQSDDAQILKKLNDVATRIASNYDLKVQVGRKIVELRPLIANKGEAILRLVSKYDINQVIFLGDDHTDLDAFNALDDAARKKRLGAIKIAVISEESPQELKSDSDYWVDSVVEVGRFLEWLVSYSEKTDT